MTGGAVLAAAAVLCIAASISLRVESAVVSRIGVSEVSPPERIGGRGRGWLARIGTVQLVAKLAGPADLSRRATLAGWALSGSELAGWKVVGAGAGFLLSVAGPTPMPLLFPLFAYAGFRSPDVLMSRARKRRLARANSELPQLLDLLAAGSAAGLAAPVALRRAAAAIVGPLADELIAALAAVDLGARWRDELAAMAERLPLPDLRRAVISVTRTEVLGSSLSAALRDLAEDVREARRSEIAELARKAPVKMLFPLVFMVLPAFLLLTVVPVLIATLRSIR